MSETANYKNEIAFLQNHPPRLKAGEYTITLIENLRKSDGSALKIGGHTDGIEKTYSFEVRGERFHLEPQEIPSVFPPAGSLGDHANVLPHLILQRSTLPWERTNGFGDDTSPWLALLLFYEEELREVTESEVEASSLNGLTSPKFPSLEWEDHWENVQADKPMRVKVIDVRNGLLKKILPAMEPAAGDQPVRNDLDFLAHVRITEDQESGQLKERAVLICNRLPKNGGMSTVHLVSLEGFFDEGGYLYSDESEDTLIRLVSLHSWRFACLNHKKSFGGLLKNLNNYQLKPGDDATSTGQDGNAYSLRLPAHSNPAIEKYYALGYLPLQHSLRNGQKTVSWYRSPLGAGDPNFTATFPVRASDELLKIHQTASGQMLDTTYAAAWELGRLLSLQNKTVSLALFQWKRAHAHQLYRAEQQVAHLPVSKTRPELALPDSVQSWFDDLSLLKSIPFCYLVPDERMLPPESIRFFKLDRLWIESLLDGAFSIGRVMEQDHEMDNAHKHSPAENAYGQLSGFILRSAVVSGWPDLKIDAIEAILELEDDIRTSLNAKRFTGALRLKLEAEGVELSEDDIEIEVEQEDKVWIIIDKAPGKQNRYYIKLRDEKFVVMTHPIDRYLFSPNIMLCLFKGNIKKVDFFLKAESLHFGLEKSDLGGYPTQKVVRGPDGNLITSHPVKVALREGGVINIKNLATDISTKGSWTSVKNFTSAQFALAMIEGSEKVRFVIADT